MNKKLKSIVGLTKKLKLLYVEDDPNTREEMISILTPFFETIYVAKDGKEGLDMFFEKNIDLVMTDIVMPKLDGLSMIEKIREECLDIPILVFSAYSEINHLKKAIDLNVDGFLSKPISYGQYIKVITKVAKNINNKKELNDYKLNLEQKVKAQVEEIKLKDEMIENHAKLAAMGEMIDIIAHQWKQPLNIIGMRTSYLKEISLDDDIVELDEVIECSSKVSKQITHLVDTLQEFREFFRPVQKAEQISLNLLLDSLSVLLQDDLIKSNITLNREFEDISFYGNKNEFKHIFINIINNARDAFVLNSIENRNIYVKTKDDEEYVSIYIQDNAGGIPQEIKEKIFEPNFTTKKDSGGTGIGLYMCKTIIDKHNGKIEVSTKDDTSSFCIKLKK